MEDSSSKNSKALFQGTYENNLGLATSIILMLLAISLGNEQKGRGADTL